jgi:hypothetical protein
MDKVQIPGNSEAMACFILYPHCSSLWKRKEQMYREHSGLKNYDDDDYDDIMAL